MYQAGQVFLPCFWVLILPWLVFAFAPPSKLLSASIAFDWNSIKSRGDSTDL